MSATTRLAPRLPSSERGRFVGPVAAFATFTAQWGPVHVAAGEDGIVALDLASTTEAFVESTAARLGGAVVSRQPGLPEAWRATLDAAIAELDEYFDERRETFDVPLDLCGVSPWDRRVLAGATTIPFGEVTSYGRLARLIGSPRAARAVGSALGRNPVSLLVPCHRILAGDGSLGGYGGGGHASRAAMLQIKRTLLALEGVDLPARFRSL